MNFEEAGTGGSDFDLRTGSEAEGAEPVAFEAEFGGAIFGLAALGLARFPMFFYDKCARVHLRMLILSCCLPNLRASVWFVKKRPKRALWLHANWASACMEGAMKEGSATWCLMHQSKI